MVFMTPDEAQELVEQMGLKIRSDARIDFDRTPHGRQRNFISDTSFFSLFTGAAVKASDVSNYEGADIIFDLGGSLPSEVKSAFDFIYNGSVLDNVFDPAACVRNISSMLRPGGVVFHYEGVAHFGWAYLKFTPEWFFDYYALNNFADGQIYLCAYEHFHRSSWAVYEWDAFIRDGSELHLTDSMPFPNEVVVMVIAQKGENSTNDRVPLQNHYRGGHHAPYQSAFLRFETSSRRTALRTALRLSPRKLTPVGWRNQLQRALRGTPDHAGNTGHSFIGNLGKPNPDQVF